MYGMQSLGYPLPFKLFSVPCQAACAVACCEPKFKFEFRMSISASRLYMVQVGRKTYSILNENQVLVRSSYQLSLLYKWHWCSGAVV